MTQNEIEVIESICRNDRRYEEYLERMELFYQDYHVPHPAVVWFEATMLVMVLKQIEFGHTYAFTAWGNGKSDDEAYAVKWTTLYLLRNGDDRFCKLDDNIINSLRIDVDDYWFFRKLRKKKKPKGTYHDEEESYELISCIDNRVADICYYDRSKPANLALMKQTVRNVMDLCVNDSQCIMATMSLVNYYDTVSNGLFKQELLKMNNMYNKLQKGDDGTEEDLDLECGLDEEQVKRSGITTKPRIVLAVMEYMLRGTYRLKVKVQGRGKVSFDDMAIAFYAVLTFNDAFWKGTKQEYADMMKDLFGVDVKVKTMSKWIERNGVDYARWGNRTAVSEKRSKLADDFRNKIDKVSMYKMRKYKQ